MPGPDTETARARPRGRARRFCGLALGTFALAPLAIALVPTVRVAAQEPVELRDPDRRYDSLRVDAYQDPEVSSLLERARAARALRAEGLESFDLTFKERIYAGLKGRITRRERALFHQERAARIRWEQDGDRTIRWLGARRGVPVAGIRVELDEDPETDDLFDIDFDFLDPAEERIFLGDDWALHPLADSAYLHYRFRSGDTLRVQFGGTDRTVTLVEAIVEPREARFDRIKASLWFDDDNGVLVRAAYAPAIDFDLEREEPDDAGDVPRFLRPIRFSVEYITVDYGLQELRYWLPNRMAFDGTAQVGALASMPVRLEWVFEDYSIDDPAPLDPGEVAEGWTRVVYDDFEDRDEWGDRRRERWRNRDRETTETTITIHTDEDGEVAVDTLGVELFETDMEAPRGTVVVIIPPEDSLLASPELPEPMMSGEAIAFTDEEISELKSRLDQAQVPPAAVLGPMFDWGLGPGLIRFNRVEGLSPGVRLRFPTGTRTEVVTSARIGIAEWEPHVELKFQRTTPNSTVGVGAYRRLVDVGDWGSPLGLGNSVNTLLFAYDIGNYYRPTGGEVFGSRTTDRWRLEGRLFAETHRSAKKNTDVTLPNLLGNVEMPENILAERGDFFGASGRVRVFSGVDPEDPIISGTFWGEAATGTFDYGRLAGQLAMATPLFWRLTGALEAGTGTTFGDTPTQRLYFLGGPYTLRGFQINDVAGESFWLGRAEIGHGFKVSPAEETRFGGAFRAVAFGDFGWAGPRSDYGFNDYKASVGVGLSIMDGLFRVDFAKGVHGGNDFWIHLYADGLL